jgi:hypothetical protein
MRTSKTFFRIYIQYFDAKILANKFKKGGGGSAGNSTISSDEIKLIYLRQNKLDFHLQICEKKEEKAPT